jgi:hypothetical protein
MYFVLRNMEIHFEIFVHRTVRPTKWDKGHFSYFFFLIYVGVRASLRALRLIPQPTEHPANPVGM